MKTDMEQLIFLGCEPKPIEKIPIKYDAMICRKCKCSKCMKNCETHISNTTIEEARTIKEPCWNCDECYYYGMDDETLNKNTVKFECDEFKMSKYYIDLIARKQRKGFRVV